MVNRKDPRIGIRVVSADAAFVPDFLDAANNFLRLVTEVDIATSSPFFPHCRLGLERAFLLQPGPACDGTNSSRGTGR